MAIDNIDYRKLVTDIQAEIESLEVLQDNTTQRLARLRQSLVGLAPLADQQDAEDNRAIASLAEGSLGGFLEDITITDAARQILQAAAAPLSPIQIKDQLVAIKKDFGEQKNAMASVHSLLKRLATSGEIETKDNGLSYQWRMRRKAYPSLLGPSSVGPSDAPAQSKRETWVSRATKKKFDPDDPNLPVNKSGMRGMNK